MKFMDLPPQIQSHLNMLIQTSELPDTEEYRDLLAETWDRKCRLFEQQARTLGLELVEAVSPEDRRGIIVLTYSGSIVGISPEGESLKVEYASIHLRSDVPKTVSSMAASLEEDVMTGHSIKFSSGQLRQTSAAYLIAVCSPEITEEDQRERIRQATIFLTNGFMKINRTTYLDEAGIPEQFTAKAMARYIAKRHNITGVLAKELLDDYITLVETGVLLGESVPLGRIGRLFLKKREPQKARIIKHPETGEEIIVKAKPATAVPKITFSKYLKERAAEVSEETPE